MSSNSDLGVLLVATGDGSGAYAQRDGTPGVVRTLTNANWIASSWLEAGRLRELFITIAGAISVQMASALVMIERRRHDELHAALFHQALVGTVRLDDPAAAKTTVQTVSRAQLVGQTVSDWPAAAPAIETLDVVLATTDHRWGQCRVLVKATGVPLPTDRIVIAANGGG